MRYCAEVQINLSLCGHDRGGDSEGKNAEHLSNGEL